jgi:hypothetical protein
MNKEWKEKWLTALRSGEYNQDKAFLKTKEGFCCLGVLADLMTEEEDAWEDAVSCDSWANRGVFRLRESGHVSHMPTALQTKAGLIGAQGKDGKAILATLMGMNDHEGMSFADIADYIEETL